MNTTQLEIFPWNDNFSTGIEEIDIQHKRLVELLNTLVMHLAFNADTPTLNKIFDELKDYTVVHFSTEERIWNQHFKNDPWAEGHKNSHGDFIAQVLAIKQKETELPMDDVITEIVRFLTHWLAFHIIESDKRMAKAVLALPSGISLECAKEQANREMAGATRVLISTVMSMYDSLANRTIELTREISKRMKAEAELRSAQEELIRLKNTAVEASQAKSAFLANMSHEIRTPMSGVIGMTDVLLKTSLSDEQRKMARIIQDSAHAQLGILNDILDFSKIEAGKLELSVEPFSLADIVQNTCSNQEVLARQKSVTLRHKLDTHIPPALEGDSLHVRQILSNLISNAIKFSSGLERTGEVEVYARVTSEADAKVWIELFVRDNGIGMDAETQARIFHPFTQADSSTTRKYGGTGLGLVISQRLAESMGGEIRLESTLNEGSTFTVRLPFARADESRLAVANQAEVVTSLADSAPSRDEAIRQGRLILVTEDNETNQEVIRQQLGMLGYQCDIAADGREAFTTWLSGRYGLILTDIHMPHMDGYQLAEAVRLEEAKQGSAPIPIIALTANVLQGESERCKRVGINEYLSKPAPMAKLQRMIDKHLPKPKAPPPPPLSIMVIDDESFMLEVMTCILEELGYSNISCYESGVAALAALDSPNKKPDTILLDINMPGMDGIEVVQQLAQRQYPGSVILVSGEDELMLRATEKLAQENRLSVPGFVKKPPMPQRLSELLRQSHKANRFMQSTKLFSKIYDAATLQSAITNGELVNYYQPKVEIPSGKWIGVETLVRWKHPQDGLVFPDQFIPLAEKEGLIGDLTRVVLRDAIIQARRWLDQGINLRVAVNVSMDDLSDTAFADYAIEQVSLHNVPPQSIILEITEGRLMKNFATALHVLSRLRLKRFRLSIDDFGTGHSSLAQLRDLPFDELKIDRSFTHTAGQDARLRAIFEGSLAMARQLHMEVVAEGVEDKTDWDFLKSANCDLAQGYFVSRPLLPADLANWHEEWQHRIHTRQMP